MALIALAVFGLVLLVVGVALVSVPAGLMVAGVACVAAAYLIAEETNK